MKAIILCAGYAVRMYPLTEKHPKPLLTIAGKPLLDYIYAKIMELGCIDEISIISNHKFISHFKNWSENKNNVSVIDDGSTSPDNKLGAIKDMQLAVENVDCTDGVLILSGDNLFDFNLKDIYHNYQKLNAPVVMASDVKSLEIAKRHGIIQLDSNSKIIDFQEKPENPKSTIKAICGYIFNPNIKSLLDEYIIEGNNTDATGFFLEWLTKKIDVYAYVYDGEVHDIGNIDIYKKIDKIYSSK
jgi:glucose-1-phosphate thymidylyltransferase